MVRKRNIEEKWSKYRCCKIRGYGVQDVKGDFRKRVTKWTRCARANRTEITPAHRASAQSPADPIRRSDGVHKLLKNSLYIGGKNGNRSIMSAFLN
ncbi:hypothetical protein TNIN_321481 [Trichonephila inaurata madagascariensis]|uniref:Uncharacterized protein n=1 Tax=Trichonephila inaurata madagascariensis TaxID=2747483 RepID=A0A8X6YJD8_9ARAC|nr:hypothetical protein TNIN_321481 [Trichonephila inaurata madagascariensis]